MPGSCAEARTIGEALAAAFPLLREVTDRPILEAELLLAQLLAHPRIFLLTHPEAPLTPEQAETYARWVARRAAGEPLPYITGRAEFRGLEFSVSPAVLIPRPETEELVEAAVRWAEDLPPGRAVDVGTGSGCIVVALAVALPAWQFAAVDRSPEALKVARSNAVRHGVAGRIAFLEGDLLQPVERAVDCIVSNPPYVAEPEWAALPPSVRHEPRAALLAGPEGLDLIARLLEAAPERLRPGGLLLVEIGERQGPAVLALARAAFPEGNVQILRDLAGRDRILQVIQNATITE